MKIMQCAVAFIEELFHVYLEERDFDRFRLMLDDSISWIGTGINEICGNFAEANQLLVEEEASWDGKFRILEQCYHALPINEEYCVVYGEMKIQEDGLSTILLDMHSRVSLLCRVTEDGMKLVHAHFSVPNPGQKEGEFVHKTLIENYNVLLEKKLEERTDMLKDKTKELEVLMANIQGGVEITTIDANYTVTYANSGFYDLIGYTEQQLKTDFENSHLQLILQEDLPAMGHSIETQLRQSGNFTLEYRIKRKNGEIVWLLDKGQLVTVDDGEKRIYHVLADITSQKKMQEELRVRTLEMQTIADNVDFGIVKGGLTDDAKIQFINPRALEMLGYRRKQYKHECADKIQNVITPEYFEKMRQSAKTPHRAGKKLRFKVRTMRRDGIVIWVEGCGVAVKDENGEQVAIYTMQDVTEEERNKELLLRKNEELNISKRRYEVAMEHTGVIIFDYIVDSNQIIQPSIMKEKYGLPSVIEGGANSPLWEQVIHSGSLQAFRGLYASINDGAPMVRAPILFTDADKKEHINEIFLSNIYDSSGKPARAIGLITDVTATSQLERERQYQKAMTYNKTQTYEVNVSQNLITSMDWKWSNLLGIPKFEYFTDMIDYLCENVIEKNHTKPFWEFFQKESICRALDKGVTQETIQYRRKDKDGVCSWIQSTMNIIRDEITRDIKIRCYVDVINEQKERELKAVEEQRFYELMLSKSAIVYEINITKDAFLRGHESWDVVFGIQQSNQYSKMIFDFVEKCIHHDDIAAFNKVFLRDNMLKAHQTGAKEIYCEYRQVDTTGEMRWYSCTMHMLEDSLTGDIMGFSYVLDIHEEKIKKLDLLFKAEHDALTELYNKATTQQLIQKYFESDEGKSGKHAFFMFDVDNFKKINDNLGHAFGDVVLSQVARKITELFREDDILGRVGGDEFVALMKNVSTEKRATAKAKELCRIIKETYSKAGKRYSISTSIGIALYRDHGCTYEELYRHSDSALYAAKENGRDQFWIYKDGMDAVESEIKSIDVCDLLEDKSFEKNISEFVFRILYESPDKISCINSVLELVGKKYGLSRAYIFEDSENGRYTSNTFEWCNQGIDAQKESLQDVDYCTLGDYKSRFNNQGIYYMANARLRTKELRKLIEKQSIKSMLHFAIIKNEKTVGFVGFDQCDSARTPSKTEITELKGVANVLGVFLLEMRIAATAEQTKNLALSIVNELDSYAYLINVETYQLLFINECTHKVAPQAKVGDLCYEMFWKKDAPCDECPMKEMMDKKLKKCVKEMYNDHLDIWTRVSVKWVDWIDGQRACLVDSMDITPYKQNVVPPKSCTNHL